MVLLYPLFRLQQDIGATIFADFGRLVAEAENGVIRLTPAKEAARLEKMMEASKADARDKGIFPTLPVK